MRDDGTVAEMVNEILLLRSKAHADRSGEPIEAAIKTVVRSEAGKHLTDLRDGPHADEGVEAWQAGIARERVLALGGRLGEGPLRPYTRPEAPRVARKGP